MRYQGSKEGRKQGISRKIGILRRRTIKEEERKEGSNTKERRKEGRNEGRHIKEGMKEGRKKEYQGRK
jgi:hypothetical protein